MLVHFQGGPIMASGERLDQHFNQQRLSADDHHPPATYSLPYFLAVGITGRAEYRYRGRATTHDPITGTWLPIAVYRYVEREPAPYSYSRGDSHNWKHEGF